MEEAALAPGLYLVATPIGNLGDITLRALQVLRQASVIACEDTRETRKLLTAHGLPARDAAGGERLVAHHDHSGPAAVDRLVARIQAGGSVALVSDAGTPLLSDPGFTLVRACRAAGVAVTALPGASAALTALQLSGLPAERFLFAGFLPPRQGQRRRALEDLKAVPATLIFYEAPHRLPEMLADLAAVLGPRPAAVARELTKRFEELRAGRLDQLADDYAAEGPPRGELVVLAGPPGKEAAAAHDLDALLAQALEGLSLRDAVTAVSGATGLPKKQVYARALELTADADG